MRASQTNSKFKVLSSASRLRRQSSPPLRKGGCRGGIYSEHISGAEGIYNESDILKISNEYIKRALSHPRGKPDAIVLTIEKIKQKTKTAQLLPVATLKCNSPDEARKKIIQTLMELGVSIKAINNAFKVLNSKNVMRGASLIKIKSGKRVEPDKERGVRVSRLGLDRDSEKKLSQQLSKKKLNTTTVKEALILASKVASCPEVIAEVCISDDPDYTTGYVASKKSGYLRITNIKKSGDVHGGRVFFIKDNSNIDKVLNYLEKNPVIMQYQPDK